MRRNKIATPKLPALGKIPPEFFNKVIYPKLGAKDNSVLVKPQHGVDFGVIALGKDVAVLSTDPFYIARELGIEKAAWFAVHIIASDVAVSGIRPRFLSIDLNLPPEITEQELMRLWSVVHSECRKLGINVVTGHTARYAGCNYPMVGGATMIGVGRREKLIIPHAQPGDLIVISKGPAIETTGLMAAYFPQFLKNRYSSSFVKKAQDVYFQMSTVKDAQITASIGGVQAMHDATECGILGGLYEMAIHCRVGMRIHLDKIVVQEAVRKTCACFDIDLFSAISEGTLLAIVKKQRAHAVVKALKAHAIPSSIAGEIVPQKEGIYVHKGKSKKRLVHPRIDPFWQKFEEYLKKTNAR
ncbi:MAG: AIR synthase [Candidatus Omnitrophota bacterium]|jgi:hydrogenase maturation factor|nr:MAG: AIR synthase [Candidatus Omnitrophota bacterium]